MNPRGIVNSPTIGPVRLSIHIQPVHDLTALTSLHDMCYVSVHSIFKQRRKTNQSGQERWYIIYRAYWEGSEAGGPQGETENMQSNELIRLWSVTAVDVELK